jgi:hypothetical protein
MTCHQVRSRKGGVDNPAIFQSLCGLLGGLFVWLVIYCVEMGERMAVVHNVLNQDAGLLVVRIPLVCTGAYLESRGEPWSGAQAPTLVRLSRGTNILVERLFV